MVWIAPICNTLIVYVDPKVQPPLPKQDITKHPTSQKTSPKDIITAFYKQPNSPRDRLTLLWWLGNRKIKESNPILQDNASRRKAGQLIYATPKLPC